MVAGQYLDPLTSSTEMLNTPQNTHEWVTAWLKNLHLNSAETTDDELAAYLLSKHYTTRASLKYGILKDPVALAAELKISDVLAGQLCDEADLITQRRAVPIPVFTTPPHPPISVPSMKPQKPWTAFPGKFLLINNELRVPRSELDAIMAQILFHANSQSTTAGGPLATFLDDPGAVCDEASLQAFESHVDPHDNAQLGSLLMNALPASICRLLRLTHGTTGTGTKLVSGYTILQYLYRPHVGVYASKYDHHKDTDAVTNPTVIPQCLYDLDASILMWRAALSRLKAAKLEPNELMLLAGLDKLTSKLPPAFLTMLQQAEYMDKINGKPAWSHQELLKHLDRQAAESMQHPRPANVTALFAAIDNPEASQVGYVAQPETGKTDTCHGWLLGICKMAPCPRGFAHPPEDQGNRSKLAQVRCPTLSKHDKCERRNCAFGHDPIALTAHVPAPEKGSVKRSTKGEPKAPPTPSVEPPGTPPSPASSVTSSSTAGTNSTQSTAMPQEPVGYAALIQEVLQSRLEIQQLREDMACRE